MTCDCILMMALQCCPLGGQVIGTMPYLTQSHYPDTELTSPCPILVMLSTRVGRNRYLNVVSQWFDSTGFKILTFRWEACTMHWFQCITSSTTSTTSSRQIQENSDENASIMARGNFRCFQVILILPQVAPIDALCPYQCLINQLIQNCPLIFNNIRYNITYFNTS